MAFPSAPGYGNLPQGNAFPTIFSQKAQLFFRTAAVAEMVTNTDYFGEISGFGDTVKVIKEPEITVNTYKRGQELSIQDLVDEELELVIDQAESYAFRVDDIEEALTHHNWGEMAASSGAYQLANSFDQNILQFMYDNATTNTNLGSEGTPKTIGYGAGNDFTPMDFLNKASTTLSENDVPEEGRFIVASHAFYESLGREDGKLLEVQVTGDSESLVRNKNLVTGRKIHGFMLFSSNNTATPSSGSSETLLAGHKSSTATARRMMKAEKVRMERSFGDLFRGLLVYGRKVLRPEALFRANMTIADA